jgi:hypothetical protein
MSALATIARRVTRYLGFSLVILGAAGLSVGYMGWKDAASRSVSATDPAARRVVTRSTKPKPAARAAPKLSPTQELLRTTARPPQQSSQADKAPARYSVGPTLSASPSPVKIAATSQPKVVIATTSAKLDMVKRTVAWSGGSLVAGLLLVSISLYERPPRQSRSGADELLNEPVPF